mgnify:CR=1 FL=1
MSILFYTDSRSGVYYQPRLTTSHKLSPKAGRKLEKLMKFKKLLFIDKARQRLFKVTELKSDHYSVLRPLLYCV